MRNAFFKAARMEPGGYGLKGEEIIIAGADAGWGPGELASAFANDKTSVVCIQDPDLAAVNAIAAELEPFSDIKPARITPMRAFGDIREFDATFEAHLGERLAEAADMKLFAAPKKFPLLKTDIKYSLRRLGKIFKLHEGFTITVTGAREEKLELHEDYGHRHEKRGVRSLSPYGTIVAPSRHFQTAMSGGFRNYKLIGKPYHTGAGLTVIKGGVPHSSYPAGKRRWVYTIDSGVQRSLS